MKAILVLFCAFLAAGSGFAQTANHQKIIPIDSDIYQAIKSLYISQGLSLPSTTGPWSEDELLMMLDKIDPVRLQPVEHTVYNFAESELTKEHSFFNADFILTGELYAHANPDEFSAKEDYIRPWNYAKPLFSMNFEAWVTPHFYGFGIFSLGNQIWDAPVSDADGYKARVSSYFFGRSYAASNILMVPPATLENLDTNFPYRAFVTAGGSGWYLTAGRDRLSWGPGQSGNFLIGSQVEYHENVRLAVYNKSFKYTFNVSGFPNPGEYYTDAGDMVDGIPATSATVNAYGNGQWNNNFGVDGYSFYIAHRFEWKMWQNKLNFALTESIMYQPRDNVLGIQYFSPTMLLHNLYRADDANSLLGLEVDWTVMPHLNIYGQIAVDEYPIPGENVPGTDNNAHPNGYGFMLGAQTSLPVWKGMLTGSFEAAYTTPYMYLRSWNGLNDTTRHGLNFVVANRYYSNRNNGANYVEDFLGYRWGGDALVFNAHAGYRELGKWNAEANLMVMIHGTFDKWTTWSFVNTKSTGDSGDSEEIVYAPSTSHPANNYADPDASSRNARYVLTGFSLLGSYQILPSLKAYGQADVVLIANKGNIKGNFAADFQFSAGISWTF
ncbi:hypothetical protein FACS1894172_16180 [Spirochaetia bacterium]|nr:hypothetical protein FACS1894172_16180 [Spirochaetia bacterium]